MSGHLPSGSEGGKRGKWEFNYELGSGSDRKLPDPPGYNMSMTDLATNSKIKQVDTKQLMTSKSWDLAIQPGECKTSIRI